MFTKTFTQGDFDFSASREAREWLRLRGYSYGSMQGDSPMGILLGDFSIAKWRNLSESERSALDGTLTGDQRKGPVVVELRKVDTEPSEQPTVRILQSTYDRLVADSDKLAALEDHGVDNWEGYGDAMGSLAGSDA